MLDSNEFKIQFWDGTTGIAVLLTYCGQVGSWDVIYNDKNGERSGRNVSGSRDAAIKVILEYRVSDEISQLNSQLVDARQEAANLRKELELMSATPEVRAAQERLDDARYNAHIRSIGSDSYYTDGKSNEDACRISDLTAALVAARQNAQVSA